MPEAAGVTLQEAVARGAQLAELARAQEGGDDAGQSGTAAAARADAKEEADRGVACWCLPPSLFRDTLSSRVCR